MAELEVLAVGEALAAFVGAPANVALHEVHDYGVHVVGAECNAAVGLARLGRRVGFCGRVGDDPFGTLVRRRLAMEGIDDRGLHVDPDRPTGLLFRNLRSTASPEVVYRRAGSAGAALTFADVEPALARLSPGAWVLVSGVTAAVAPATAAQVAERARSAGLRLCVDLNDRARLWDREAAAVGLGALATDAALVVGTLEEARLVAGEVDAGVCAERLLAAGAQIVVLRHDGCAATWWSASGSSAGPEPAPGSAAGSGPASVTVSATPRPALDPVGAGDAFLAGVLSGLLESEDPAACLARGHACGAAVLDTVGDVEGALSREELTAGAPGEPRR